MKSITFYKLVSPYSEDVTKNCGLSGVEIDKNFMNLKEMDITSAMMGSDDTLIQQQEQSLKQVQEVLALNLYTN